MIIQWQHVFGFVGTLFLLACLIYVKPAFLGEPLLNMSFPVPQTYVLNDAAIQSK